MPFSIRPSRRFLVLYQFLVAVSAGAIIRNGIKITLKFCFPYYASSLWS